MLWRVLPNFFAAALAIVVIDGDSIEVDGQPVRIVGYDTPELRGECEREVLLAQAAKAELERLLASGEVTARWNEGRRLDRWGRGLWHVYVDGRSVADHMVGARLARRYDGGARRGWC